MNHEQMMERQMSDALRTCHGFCAPEGRITWHGSSPRRSPTSRSLLTPMLAGMKLQTHHQQRGETQREQTEEESLCLSDEDDRESLEEEEHLQGSGLVRRQSSGAIPITNARRDFSHIIHRAEYERQVQQLLALAAKHTEALARQEGLQRMPGRSSSVQIRG